MPMQTQISDEEAKAVIATMEKVEPRLHKFIQRKVTKSPTVGLSIAVNMATTLMTISILIIEASGGDIEQFFQTLMEATREKYDQAKKESQVH
jgi:hypothetical protein